MARSVSLLGSKCRGRIGDKTYYIRNGQQIMYERTPRVRAVTNNRHFEVTEIMKVAQRWRQQLEAEGVSMRLDTLLNWLYSMRDVAQSGGLISQADTTLGGWAPSVVTIRNDGVYSRAGYHLPTGASIANQGFGMRWAGYGGDYTTTHIWDAIINIYPAGSVFLSVRGSELITAELVVGKRVEYSGPMQASYKTPTTAPIYGGNLYAGRVYMSVPPSGAPTLTGRVYAISGWAAPNLSLDGELLFAWAIVGPDGVPIEMAAAHAI